MRLHELAHETLTPIQSQVIDRLAEACRILGADATLLSIIDRWADNALPDDEALARLDDWCDHNSDELPLPGFAPYPDPPF